MCETACTWRVKHVLALELGVWTGLGWAGLVWGVCGPDSAVCTVRHVYRSAGGSQLVRVW